MHEAPMMLGQTSKGNGKRGGKGRGKMMLKRLNVEEAVNGFVVRCDYESSGKEHHYDTKTKVFENADDMAKFVAKAFDAEPSEEEDEES